MAASVSASAFLRVVGSSIDDEDHVMLQAKAVAPPHVKVAPSVQVQPMMKNVNEGKDLFAPIVMVTRNIVGKKRFNQLRDVCLKKQIQVITELYKSVGADSKHQQELIRLAKKNGERLGFLA
ncbi:hypothetical protein DH2020_004608 [Rehmannia glutinosa]|uniref:Uncharacterized protein n=1 Tax=Rehmannia glutinosa TaxID=99300 RepID=A0ABR0XQ14_REHGL